MWADILTCSPMCEHTPTHLLIGNRNDSFQDRSCIITGDSNCKTATEVRKLMPDTEKAKVGTRKGASGRGTRALFRSSTVDFLTVTATER